jgi:hypothetical protein
MFHMLVSFSERAQPAGEPGGEALNARGDEVAVVPSEICEEEKGDRGDRDAAGGDPRIADHAGLGRGRGGDSLITPCNSSAACRTRAALLRFAASIEFSLQRRQRLFADQPVDGEAIMTLETEHGLAIDFADGGARL